MFLGKCTKLNLNYRNWSKALCLGVSEPTKRLAAQNTGYTLRNIQSKQPFIKENEEKYLCKINLYEINLYEINLFATWG